MNNILKDERIPQVKKLVEGMLSKSDLPFANVLVENDNTVIALVRETSFYISNLINVSPGFTIGFNYNNIIELNDDEYINDPAVEKEVIALYSYYNSFLTYNNIVAEDDDLRSDEEFEELLNLRAADGAKFYKLNGKELNQTYMFPVFSGFPNINKQDKLGVQVYDIGPKYNIIKLNIYKKKINRNMSIIYKVFKLT